MAGCFFLYNPALCDKKHSIETQRDTLHKEIDDLKSRQSSLGLFKGKEKREIAERIGNAENQLREYESLMLKLDTAILLLQNKHGEEISFGHNPHSPGKDLKWRIVAKINNKYLKFLKVL